VCQEGLIGVTAAQRWHIGAMKPPNDAPTMTRGAVSPVVASSVRKADVI